MGLRDTTQQAEAEAIVVALNAWDGNKTRAAVALDIDVVTLYRAIKRHGITQARNGTWTVARRTHK